MDIYVLLYTHTLTHTLPADAAAPPRIPAVAVAYSGHECQSRHQHKLVVALAFLHTRDFLCCRNREAPAAEVAWAGAALQSIAGLMVEEGPPATRARQGEDLVDDVLTRHQHLTRVLV